MSCLFTFKDGMDNLSAKLPRKAYGPVLQRWGCLHGCLQNCGGELLGWLMQECLLQQLVERLDVMRRWLRNRLTGIE